MAFAIVAIAASGPTRIDGAECVSVSYPTFEADLRRMVSMARDGTMNVDKIYLVGFMATGKSTVGRHLAARLALAVRRHRPPDRGAREAHDRGDLREAGRAVLPRG